MSHKKILQTADLIHAVKDAESLLKGLREENAGLHREIAYLQRSKSEAEKRLTVQRHKNKTLEKQLDASVRREFTTAEKLERVPLWFRKIYKAI